MQLSNISEVESGEKTVPELYERHARVLESLIQVLELRLERARLQNDLETEQRLRVDLERYQQDFEQLQFYKPSLT
ncbi:hypothetical protein BD830_1163 [Maritimibacter alkaliphilus HTCC2654]|jgi:ABC-type phosphate transport system auxiliary subunit|uniref:Uncharacterized protein n=1 Tax=Maritimibacter alkaliphilus HTCC2654 TaxID=314271 RepID=A3VBH3_9RHOB|nr:hypothetical protein RB2654_16591 [Rhodobacterales bacterium HTCC2654] [Maritimibacter alkaliphilus HTCC2654]TYP78496.1 hypothetical protein BD830_1163 [Maritimibacter alkaliphilus HTCC2654]